MKSKYIKTTVALATIVIGAGSALAQTDLTWDPLTTGGSDGAGTWDTGTNWWDGMVASGWTPGDNAIIGSGGAGGTITLGAVTAGTVLIDNFTGSYTLDGTSLDQSGGITLNTDDASDKVFLNLPISGAGGVTMNGPGYLRFENTTVQTYTGTTTLNGGVTMMGYVGSTTLSPGNLTMNGGVLEAYWGETFSRTLGAGAGQVQILGGASGFSQNGNNTLNVKLNNDVNYEAVWGSSFFNPSSLVLQSEYAQPNSALRFQNKLDLNGAPRTVEVAKTTVGSGYAWIENVIRNSDGVNPSGLTKTGPGVLRLTNTGNSYDGPTVVTDGVLQLGTGYSNANSIPGGIGAAVSGSNLEINGGNVKIAYYFRRTLGAGDGQLQITGGTSGFSHTQADTYGRLYINNDVNYEVVWGSAFFQPDVLVLNEENALPDQVVNFQNKLDLNGADRTVATNSTRATSGNYINANNGFMTTTGGRITGNIQNSSGTAAGLIKTGPGHLQLTGTNTYNGGTTINEGNLEFTKIAAMPATGVVTVNDGTTLTVAVGGAGQWTTGTSGNGTLGGLLAGLGGQSPSTVSFVGTTSLGLNVTGAQSYSGVIASAGNLSIGGSGSLDLTGDNTFTGDIIVDGGATLTLSGDNSGATGKIRIINGFLNAAVANLPGGGVTYDSPGNNPAILAGSGAFAPTIASGSDLYWNQNGGFAATSSAFTVTPNAGATIDWSANEGFRGRTLQLGSSTSTAAVEIPNNIDLDADRSIRLFNNTGSSDDVSILSGDIIESGTRHLYVGGQGTLVLSGNNAFGVSNRRLQISDGAVVRAADGVGLPSTAVLFFNTGVFESNGTITRSISNVSGNAYWNGRGGFSAHGGTLSVNLEGGATLDWGATNGGFRGQDLYFGSETSDNVVTLQNNIDLKNNRTVYVFDNPTTDADYTVFAGIIANGDGGARELNKRGTGLLLLNGVNTYTGQTRVHQGSLGGTGSVAGKVRMEGATILAPGASVGTFGVGGDLELQPLAGNASGKLEFELNTIAASDKITVGGTIFIDTAKLDLGDFDFTDVGGLENGTYTLISGGAPVNGTLGATTNGTLGLATIDLQITGNDIELVVSGLVGGASYATWSGGAAANADANADGVSNGAAWALGAADVNANAIGLLPTLDNSDPTYVIFNFNRSDEAEADASTAITVQYGSDLAGWTTAAHDGTNVIINVTDSSPTDAVEVKLLRSALVVSDKLFARLNVVVTP